MAWGAFAVANVAVILAVSRWETIPFHFVWVSLTLVYGFRRWRLRTTTVLLFIVIAATGAALAWSIVRGHEGPDELAEVPLMAAMFLAMVWHAERRQSAIEQARRLAESEHQLLMAQREFVRDASHELRTPITVARGHAELIRATHGDGQVAEDAEVILDELGHLSKLSERLLLLTTAGHPGFLSSGPVDVEALFEGLARRWIPTAPRDWQIRIGARGSILADRERMETALDALLENAVAATDVGATIALACRAVGEELLIQVRDEGVGISDQDLPRIFDRFSRVQGHRARANGGTGLGLSITKAIVEAHGGSIDVDSEPGRGTNFRIVLPGFRRPAGAQHRPAGSAAISSARR
ncbi:MAG TPA: HAMP domain-containing sensor histidine kinase [Actinomycetota bacterium]|nr:HAMP domain-containing sensor histidine kinase [Actinomycetota bacterium]